MRKYNNNISEKANASLNRRETIVRGQRRMIAIVILVIVSLGILLGTGINALASAKEDPASYNKYYKTVRVESGDTLWDMADDYINDLDIKKTDYIDEICEINHIDGDEISAGDYIVVSYYSKDEL